jgi:hypothetical protein
MSIEIWLASVPPNNSGTSVANGVAMLEIRLRVKSLYSMIEHLSKLHSVTPQIFPLWSHMISMTLYGTLMKPPSSLNQNAK